jgi:hypothetical protein
VKCDFSLRGENTNQELSKKGSQIYVTKLLTTVQFRIVWHIDRLLGKDHETNNETTDVAMQQAVRNNGSIVGSGVFYVVRSETISRDLPSSVK